MCTKTYVVAVDNGSADTLLMCQVQAARANIALADGLLKLGCISVGDRTYSMDEVEFIQKDLFERKAFVCGVFEVLPND